MFIKRKSNVYFLFISDVSYCVVIMAIPYPLSEKLKNFFDSNTNQPRIAIVEAPSIDLAFVVEDNVQFYIKIEQQTICREADFVQGFTLMLALHYIFLCSLFERYRSVDDILPKDIFRNFGQLKNSNESVNVNHQSEERHLKMQKESEK